MNNPLQKFYRSIKFYTKLPSGTDYYTDDVITFSESGEVGIRPMTSMDELLFKNPDALLNGEAMKNTLLSCVEGLHRPEALLNADAEALLLCIRHASYADANELSLICPKCNHQNTYAVDLQNIVETRMQEIHGSYDIELNQLIVTVRPYTLKNSISSSLKHFKQKNLARQMSEQKTEEERLKILSASITELSKMNTDLLIDSIVSISDGHEINVINNTDMRPFIVDYLKNAETAEINKIHEKLKEINQIGIDSTFEAKCQKDGCGHEWTIEADFNPINFLLGS